MRALVVLSLLLSVSLAGCSSDSEHSATTTSALRGVPQLGLTSTAFANAGAIPREYTCDGVNRSPPLVWTGLPTNAAELVLTVEDPDAPNGTFTHWLLYGIRPGIASLGDGPTAEGVNGTNSFGARGYGGPCPPKGTQHRYVFRLTALSRPTNLREGASAAQLRAAMPSGAVAAQGQLTGIYGR